MIVIIMMMIMMMIINIIIIIIVVVIWWRICDEFQALVTVSSASSGAACTNKEECLDAKIAQFTVHFEVGFWNHN